MVGHLDWMEGQQHRVSGWLILVLCYAITRAPADRMALTAHAAELDASGGPDQAFSYFARTSSEICGAIDTSVDEHSKSVLAGHAARIEEPRLRAAFCACLGIPDERTLRRDRLQATRRDDRDLWKGLAKR
jgi:hypothetical protein